MTSPPLGLLRLLLPGSAFALLLAAAPARAQECLDCHGQEGSAVSFKDGSSKDVTIDPAAWAESVHGSSGLGCGDCHAAHAEYPHPEPQARSARDYTIANYTSCEGCHEEQFKKQLDGVHLKAIASGNKNAAVCADCHNPHAQKKITGEDGRLLPEGRVAIPGTCPTTKTQFITTRAFLQMVREVQKWDCLFLRMGWADIEMEKLLLQLPAVLSRAI